MTEAEFWGCDIPAAQPEPLMVLFGGIFMKGWTIAKAGEEMVQHAHESDHVSFLVRGSVRVTVGGDVLGDFHGPAFIKIAARVRHGFKTLTPDCMIVCVHELDSEDVPILDEVEA